MKPQASASQINSHQDTSRSAPTKSNNTTRSKNKSSGAHDDAQAARRGERDTATTRTKAAHLGITILRFVRASGRTDVAAVENDVDNVEGCLLGHRRGRASQTRAALRMSLKGRQGWSTC
jgi:hypothetical protein